MMTAQKPPEGVLPMSWDRAGMVPLSEALQSGRRGWSLASTALVFTCF